MSDIVGLHQALEIILSNLPESYMDMGQIDDLNSALIELDQLRKWQAAALPIVEAVANVTEESLGNWPFCPFCGNSPAIGHKADCSITKAQALLEPLNPIG